MIENLEECPDGMDIEQVQRYGRLSPGEEGIFQTRFWMMGGGLTVAGKEDPRREDAMYKGLVMGRNERQT